MTTKPVSQLNISVIGLGLIGGSFARALKLAGHDGEITGVIRSTRTGERALELDVVDRITDKVDEGVANADVVMLAVPMQSMKAQMLSLRDSIKPDAIVTDAGSVKQCFVDDARDVFNSLENVVPGHPIAGREKSGIDAIDPDIYRERRVLLTPLPETRVQATNTIRTLWESVGAEVECLAPGHHDRVLAATSHLPHALAFALVDMLATRQEAEEIFRYAAGGFRDFSRIASGDPVMWRDICLTNQQPLCEAIDEMSGKLQQLRSYIDEGSSEQIEDMFRRAKQARDANVIK